MKGSIMKIPTSRGLIILIDDSDSELISDYSWYANAVGRRRDYAYARIPKTGKRISMHRLLMNPPSGMVVHHINNNGLDNRRLNLEIVTPKTNTRAYYGSTRGTIHIHKQSGKWRAQAMSGQKKSVGCGATGSRSEKSRPRRAMAGWASQPCL
jgi:hypothetical protein